MKNVMARAWEIAKAAVLKFGGKAKEYFAQALVMAWAEIKTTKAIVEWDLPADTRKCRTWMARITGTHPVYKLDRQFVNPDGEDKYGDKLFDLTNGYYEAYNGKRRYFIQVIKGKATKVERHVVMSAFAMEVA
ncbi:hypothetical protein PDENDC454_10495 [Paenibacillus dendritiformis C454]|uniref:Phage protein n=1 Tax=Paenibacillus dendritiformis C454 TaxID=1131935 RepID=H3SEZ4_9BACL|nr:hypothetical protein [Paenibacillus dendritiformis]EHQ62313.1 hypothetical protein PDENDC454_10495 [Paenibacillus dendritiformis C454]